MHAAVPLACFLSMIRPPGVQYENALLQIAPVDKSKCPYVKDNNDVGFQLFTRHNPTTFQELRLGDDEKLFASNMDFNDKTVVYFHAWMEQPDDGSGIMVREAYMQRGDTNVIMVDAHHLEAGPWYFTAAQNTWYIGRFAALFIDYLASRGLNLNNTHLIGHSLGAQAAGVAGSALKSGRVSRITGLDPALPLFDGLPLEQRLDTTDAHFVDIIHTDAGIFGYKAPMGHVDFYPNGGTSPQPGCELEVVLPKQLLLNKFFCSHWRSYMFYTESVLHPRAFVASKCASWKEYKHGRCAHGETQHMGYSADSDRKVQTRGFYSYYLVANTQSPLKKKSLESKLENFFAYIHSVKVMDEKNKRERDLGDEVEERIRKDENETDNGTKIKRYSDVLLKNDATKFAVSISNHEPKEDLNNTAEVLHINKEKVNEKKSEKQSDSIKDVLTREDEKTEDYFEDQIAEASEYDITQVEFNQHELKDKETMSIIGKNEEILLEDEKLKSPKKTQILDMKYSNNLNNSLNDVKNKQDSIQVKEEKKTIQKEDIKSTEKETSITLFDTDFKTSLIENKNNKDKETDKRASFVKVLNYKDPCEPNAITKVTTTESKDISFEVTEDTPINPMYDSYDQPHKINILNVLGTTYRISRVISSLKQKKPFVDKIKNLFTFKNKIETTTPTFIERIFKKSIRIKPRTKNHVLKRQKRFSFFKRNEEAESNNILFKMLEFLMKNRKNVLPVFTVMREINTLVKSGNGELNHFSKEQNNYIGATPPVFAPITYNLELGNENRAVAFIKRLLGMAPKGDRLTITSRKARGNYYLMTRRESPYSLE